MVNEELVKLAQDVSADLVRAKALGEDGVAATLQMAFDELLERLADEVETLAPLNSGPEERGGE